MPRQQQKSGGLPRRQAIQTGTGLAPLAFLANEANGASLQPTAPARACIFLHITGGPAQQETFDLKP